MKKIKNRGVKFKTLTKFIYLFILKQWCRNCRRKPPSSDYRHIVKYSAQSCHTDCPTHIYNTFFYIIPYFCCPVIHILQRYIIHLFLFIIIFVHSFV